MIKKKTGRTSKKDKFTLVELVGNSELHHPLIIMNLSKAGLFEQYEYELENYGRLDIEPSLTKDEFDKLMEE